MKEKILKQRLSGPIGMLLGGIFLSYFGFVCAVLIKNIGIIAIIPVIFGILGIRWIVSAIAFLLTRNRLPIRISDKGINLPMGIPSFKENVSGMYISRSDIKSINKHVSLHCRGVEIIKEDDSKIAIQIRHYCEIKKFLEYCREMGLPTV